VFDATVGWVNGSETFVEVLKNEGREGRSKGRFVDFFSSTGSLDLFFTAARSPKENQTRIAEMTGF